MAMPFLTQTSSSAAVPALLAVRVILSGSPCRSTSSRNAISPHLLLVWPSNPVLVSISPILTSVTLPCGCITYTSERQAPGSTLDSRFGRTATDLGSSRGRVALCLLVQWASGSGLMTPGPRRSLECQSGHEH